MILSEDYFNRRKKTKGIEGYRLKILWESLSCTMVIAYCRPFSNNDKKTKNKIPDLSLGILKCLNKVESELHEVLLRERNTILAHSDSEAWNMNPRIIQFEGRSSKILFPGHSDIRAPLLPEPIKQIERMCNKLMDDIIEKRMILEKELEEEFPIEIIEDIKDK